MKNNKATCEPRDCSLPLRWHEYRLHPHGTCIQNKQKLSTHCFVACSIKQAYRGLSQPVITAAVTKICRANAHEQSSRQRASGACQNAFKTLQYPRTGFTFPGFNPPPRFGLRFANAGTQPALAQQRPGTDQSRRSTLGPIQYFCPMENE